MRLQDRVALITGSGQGIGKATALEFAKEGAVVVVNDVNKETAGATVEEITGSGGRATFEIADATDEVQVIAMVERINGRHERIDILVNNTTGPIGALKWGFFHELSIEDIRKVYDGALFSAMNCSRAVINGMIGRGYGKIVNISSFAAVTGQYKGLHYASAKLAVQGFTANLAKEVAQFGVNVNCIMPGLASSPTMVKRLEELPERREQLLSWSHFGRLGRLEEYAKAILFLASDEASYISGATLPVEGGILSLKII